MTGKLIVIEGMDGAGTTTQTKLLFASLTALGIKVVKSAEPTSSPLGQEIRRLLASPLEKEQQLLTSLALCFAADRMQHVHSVIVPSLKRGETVILDRYVLSSLVYQGMHLPTAFVKEINQYALPADIVIVLDVPANLAYERLSGRPGKRDFYESAELLEKIRSRYLHLAEKEPKTVLIDAAGTVEQVHSHIMHVVRQYIMPGSLK